jgi:electron transfer flavoprotein alpha subunit
MAGSGSSLHAVATQLASSHPSISQVFIAYSEKFEHPLAEPWVELIRLVQQNGSYSHIITAATPFGKNVMLRAAALLNVSPISYITQIIGDQTFVRPIYAGNALCTVHYIGTSSWIMSIRPTFFFTRQVKCGCNSKFHY